MSEYQVISTSSFLEYFLLWFGMALGLGIARAKRYETDPIDEIRKAFFLRGLRKTRHIK